MLQLKYNEIYKTYVTSLCQEICRKSEKGNTSKQNVSYALLHSSCELLERDESLRFLKHPGNQICLHKGTSLKLHRCFTTTTK